MNDAVNWEREWLAPIGLLSFQEVFRADPREGLEAPFGLGLGDPALLGSDWALKVALGAGVGHVFSSATTWRFGQSFADSVDALFVDGLDPKCILRVMPALITAKRPDELRDAAKERIKWAMDHPEPLPEPIPRLRKAFQAAQLFMSGEEPPSPQKDPEPRWSVAPGIFKDALEGWMLGVTVGYRIGLKKALAKIVELRFGKALREQAYERLFGCHDPVKAGMLSGVMLNIADPSDLLHWTRKISSLDPEELKRFVSLESLDTEPTVAWRWPTLSTEN